MTVVIFIIILSILVFIHELGHFLAAKKMGVRVEEFGLGFPPRALGKKIGETIYSLNWLPIGGFVKVFGEEYHEDAGKISKKDHDEAFVYKKPWQKLVILVAGVIMNFLLGWILISYLFTQGVPQPTGIVRILEVTEGSPAAEAGLQPGDTVNKIQKDDETIEIDRIEQLILKTNEFAGTAVTYIIERNGEEVTLTATPRKNPPEGEGALGIQLDVESAYEMKTYSWIEAPVAGLKHAATITVTIVRELGKVIGRLVTLQSPGIDVTGPVGIAQYTGQAVEVGWKAVLELVALLSLNLAVINMLPFPALDGGRVVFVLYEWISKRRIPANFERYMNLFGIITLLLLSVVVTYFDIIKLIQGN
ncbi:MAG: M50 family metallopeptidase [Patescibacteria group bacterium]